MPTQAVDVEGFDLVFYFNAGEPLIVATETIRKDLELPDRYLMSNSFLTDDHAFAKKIVVLDDIDIINEQSQQVFRNCIDKFSHNVHFISSCSNTQKVIESLQSRFIIIKIKPLKRENLHKIIIKIKNYNWCIPNAPIIISFILLCIY